MTDHQNCSAESVEAVLRRVLDDIEVEDGKCRWADVANILPYVRGELRTFTDAQSTLNRDQVAKTIYATWFDADFITENHFRWFDAGKDNPDSCVHYSNVAKAYKVADAVLAAASQPSPAATVETGTALRITGPARFTRRRTASLCSRQASFAPSMNRRHPA
jgi:hypothetical protein